MATPPPRWPPTKLATTVVAMHWDANAQVAEAVGCRVAVELLSQLRTHTRTARVVGDNLAVVRHGAGTARLRRVSMHSHLERALDDAYAAGWTLTWQAVRRRLNSAADTLATQGIFWAAHLRANQQLSMHSDTTWERA